MVTYNAYIIAGRSNVIHAIVAAKAVRALQVMFCHCRGRGPVEVNKSCRGCGSLASSALGASSTGHDHHDVDMDYDDNDDDYNEYENNTSDGNNNDDNDDEVPEEADAPPED